MRPSSAPASRPITHKIDPTHVGEVGRSIGNPGITAMRGWRQSYAQAETKNFGDFILLKFLAW
jgi:hypothetical protein